MKFTTDIKNEIAFLKDIILHLDEMDVIPEERIKWIQFFADMHLAQERLAKYTLRLSVRQKQPTYGEISFFHDDLRKFDALKRFTWDFGFVVKVLGSKTKMVLRGEKRLKYKT